MNALRGTLLGLAIAVGGWVGSAQETAIPFRQIERDAQLSANLIVPGNEITSNSYSSSISAGAAPEEPSSSGFNRVYTVVPIRILSTSYFMLNGLHLGMAVFDVEMTQHCIADHHCREGNPIMPSSHAGQLGVNIALVGYSSFTSYKLKKRGSKLWRISPVIGSAAHGAGAATGLVHR
jgi:hypothetical protein